MQALEELRIRQMKDKNKIIYTIFYQIHKFMFSYMEVLTCRIFY